jgi:transketolase
MAELREVFGKALLELGKKNNKVIVLDGDLSNATKTAYFAKEFPDRFIQCGIAEQNMVGVAAGLASCGKIPFVTSFAVFVSKRAADQISVSVSYTKFNVKIIGYSTGLFNYSNGGSHMAVEDIAIMRAIPGITVIDPADAEEVRQAVEEIADFPGPVYLRESRDEWPEIFNKSYKFRIGKAAIVRDGKDLTVISCGVMTSEAIKASEILAGEGFSIRVVNMSTIKPLDEDMVIDCARDTGAIVVAENHNIYGGLGSAVAEVISENFPVPLQRVGIRDKLGEAGQNNELLEKYEMSAQYISEAIKKTINRKSKN